MRIVYVLTTLAMGGTERQVSALAGRIAARGHAVALVVVKRQEAGECPTTLEVIHLDIEKTLPSVIAGIRRGVAFVRGFNPDVIHSHNFHGNMVARMVRVFYGEAKFVSTIHNVYEGGWWRMLAYRASDGLADRITAVSAAVAERFLREKAVRKEKCVVITNAIEVREFVPDRERRATTRGAMGAGDDFVWLTVGRLTAAKDVPNLMQAFEQLCRSRYAVQLWVAGERPAGEADWYEIAVQAMASGARAKVKRLGLRRDVAALLDAADGFVLSSAWEGMPLAVGEAMAMEKPVIATDVGGVRELLGETGRVVRAKDAGALAAGMLEWMQKSEEERSAMGRAARRRVEEHFSMDRRVEEWEALYREVTGLR